MEKLLKLIEDEKLNECLKMQDSDGNDINSPEFAEFCMNVYNQGIDKSISIIKQYFSGDESVSKD